MTKLNEIAKYTLLLAALLLAGCGKAQNNGADDGTAVKNAVFTDLQGNEVALSEHKGKVVLIDFWETWCKPCISSFPTMQKLMDEYPERFVVLAVTPGFADTKEDAREFAQNHDYDFVYLYDSNKLHEKLGVQGIPFKVYVDPGGELIKTSRGSYGPEQDYKQAEDVIEKYVSEK
ncbi:MAG: TlpA disulfide reductase family protein [Balneolaceae bacterium]|nr:TlpA disulfide reductase family protein [Balneolaceae bacterium]